jgi:hypothetical protein
MHSDQIKQAWRSCLVKALRERYGLTAREARTKVNVWIESVTNNPFQRFEVSEPSELRSQRRPRREQNVPVRQQMAKRQSAS